ncbi:MAG: hypothetical protein WDO14_05055 [Bacteroidota bacterium]
MELSEKYRFDLAEIRNDASKMGLLCFRQKCDRRIERLRIATALFNDLRIEDYGLVRFLFTQELKMKLKDPDDSNMYNLRLIGLLLCKFRNPEDIWLFYNIHKIDKNFAIEFVLAIGLSGVYHYLREVTHIDKPQLVKRIGSSALKAKYSQEKIDFWMEDEEDFFDVFRFPSKDELRLAAILKEKERVQELLPRWTDQQKSWTDDQLFTYINYVQEYADDIDLEIQALRLYVSKYQNKLAEGYKKRLAEIRYR